MSQQTDLAGMVPGFEFLQTLMKGAGSAIPGMGQWVAPTLDPAEIDKRIQELRTVQFWLEQNARLLSTTIQALEVQRMTLSTLQSMNLPMMDVRDALMIKTPPPMSPLVSPPVVAPEPAAKADTAASPPPPAVDPMQWWGALTKQFGEIAANAVKSRAAAANPAEAPATKPVTARKTAARPKRVSKRAGGGSA
ncbi:MAG: PhaM family polyhydroxyalkanoate granule multifunctional regulatory protein [Burkholderiaceae bacterium]